MPPKVRLSEKERGMRASKGSASTEGAKAFISFSEVTSSSHSVLTSFSTQNNQNIQAESSSTNLSPIYLGDDNDLSVITKKLTKKNPVSRLKALQELKAVLQLRGSSVIPDLAPFYVFIYNRLVLENQTNIREESNIVLEILMTIDKKSFASHMKHLIAPWYFSTCDPGRDIGTRAQAALEVAFPPKKRREVLTYFSDVILRYVMDHINNSTPESLTDSSMCTASEAEDRYERVISGSFAALARFVRWMFPLPPPSGTPFAKGGQPLPLPAATVEYMSDTLNISFFKKTTSKRAYVRYGALDVLTAVCEHAPHLILTPSADDVLDPVCTAETSISTKKNKPSSLARLSMIVCNAFVNEKEANNMSSSFRAFLSFVKTYPMSWKHLDLEVIIKRLLDLLTRSVEKESVLIEMAMSYVLPILAAVPLTSVRYHHKRVLDLFETLSSVTLLPRFLKGSLKPHVAVIELCTFFIIQFNKGTACEGDDGFDELFIRRLVDLSTELSIKELLYTDKSSMTTPPVVSLLSAMHKADSHDSNAPQLQIKSLNYVRMFWNVFTSRIIEVMSLVVIGSTNENAGNVSGIDEANINYETSVHFVDNVISAATKGFTSSVTPTSADSGLFFFWNLLFRATETFSRRNDLATAIDRWTLLVWIHFILHVPSSFQCAIPTESLLGVLSSDQWLQVNFEYLKCDCSNIARDVFDIQSFALTVISKAQSKIVSVSGNDTVYIYRGRVLELCRKHNSLIGICVAIETGLLCEEIVSNCFQDESNDLFSVGLFIRNCVTSLCSSSDDSVPSVLLDAHLIEQNSHIKFLVQCLRSNYLSEFTRIDSYFEACMTLNLNSALHSPDVVHTLPMCHWVYLTSVFEKIQASNFQLERMDQERLCIVMSLVFLNRNTSTANKSSWFMITSWDNIKKSLIPLLPKSVVDAFYLQQVNVLNSRLLYGVQGSGYTESVGIGDILSGNKDGEMVSTLSPHGWSAITAEEWASHAHSLLRISRDQFTSLTAQLGLHSTDLWTSLLSTMLKSFQNSKVMVEIIEKMSFMVRCIFQLDMLWGGSGEESIFGDLLPITTDVDLVLTIFQSVIVAKEFANGVELKALHSAKVDLDDLQECCQSLIASYSRSPEKLWSYSHDLLTRSYAIMRSSTADSNSRRQGEFIRHYSFLEGFKLAMWAVMPLVNDEHENKRRLNVDTPLFHDILPKGTPVIYLLKDNVEYSDNHSASVTTLRGIKATLMSTHRDDGPNNPAFYTLLLSSDGRELQTEASRVILTGEDVGKDFTPDSSDDKVVTKWNSLTSRDGDVVTVMSRVLGWINDCVEVISLPSKSFELASFEQNFSYLGFVLQHVLEISSACQQGSGIEQQLFVGRCRDICLSLIGKNVVEQPHSVLFGLEMLHSLVAPSIHKGESNGIGNGYWVVAFLIEKLEYLLSSLKNTSRLVFSLSVRCRFLIQLCYILKELMPSIVNRRLTALSEECVNMSLACIQSISELEEGDERKVGSSMMDLMSDALVQCLNSLWNFPSGKGNDVMPKHLPGHPVCESSDGDSVGEEGKYLEPGSGERSWSTVYHSDLDLNGIRHCFRILFNHLKSYRKNDILTIYSGIDIATLVSAIDKCLQNQLANGGRQAGVVLLQSSGLALSSETANQHSKSSTDGFDFDDVTLLSFMCNPHVDTSIRLLLAKILDVFYTSQPLLIQGLQDSSTPSESDVNSEIDELKAGEQLTRQLLGDYMFDMFKSRAYAPGAGTLLRDGASFVKCASHGCQCDSLLIKKPAPFVSLAENFAHRGLILSGFELSNCSSSELKLLSNENCYDTLGILLLHLLILQKIDTVCISADSDWAHKRVAIGMYLTQSDLIALVCKVLTEAQIVLPMPSPSDDLVGKFGKLDPRLFHTELGCVDFDTALGSLCAYTLYRSTCVLPVAVRTFWNDHCSRSQRVQLEKFIETRINKNIVKREIAIVKLAEQQGRVKATSLSASPDLDDDGGITIRCSAVAQEFVTTFTADEVSIEMTIRLPSLYPLRNVEVECTKKMGISEGRWRRWILQIIQLLSHQDGSVLDAILLWKKNVDKEFEGVEPCPICYSILHPKTLSLPTMCCPTCKNKFHSPCLYKWFNTSGKSKCVLCQQPFF